MEIPLSERARVDQKLVLWLDRYGRLVLAVLRQANVPRRQIEDLAQDVWLTAAATPPQDETNVKAWLVTVARHKAIGWLRKKRPKALADDFDIEDSADAAALARLAAEERALAVRGCLDNAVDSTFREVVVAKYFVDESDDALAARLHLPKGTIHSRRSRGLEQLRRCLEDKEPT